MKFIFIGLSLISSLNILAQDKLSTDDSLLIGTWKGTSICQVKSSPCHDEVAAYHITKADKPNTYYMLMNKVVDGKEEEMGMTDYSFDVASKTLTSHDAKRGATWTFYLKGSNMDGTLVYENKVYRIIKLSKTGSQ
jgi:hypothetical protein